MGEARRRKISGNHTFTGRSWAIGRIEVVANDVPCFSCNTVHFTSTMAAVKSIRIMGCGARGRSG
jgi:hypothetical protein